MDKPRLIFHICIDLSFIHTLSKNSTLTKKRKQSTVTGKISILHKRTHRHAYGTLHSGEMCSSYYSTLRDHGQWTCCPPEDTIVLKLPYTQIKKKKVVWQRHDIWWHKQEEPRSKKKKKKRRWQVSIQYKSSRNHSRYCFFFLVNESQGGRRFKVDKVDTYSLIQQFKIIDSYFKNHN